MKPAALALSVVVVVTVARSSAGAQSVPANLSFVPADASLVVRVDISALRRSVLWSRVEPALQQLFAVSPSCSLSLVTKISEAAVAVRSRPAPATDDWGVKVVANLDRRKLVACLSGIGSVIKKFGVRPTAAGFRVLDKSGGIAATVRWTSYGMWITSGSFPRARGPATQIRALLGKLNAGAAFSWASITRRSMQAQPTQQGNERAQQIWFEVQHGPNIHIRGGLRYTSNAAARKSSVEIIQALVAQGAKRGLHLDAAAIRKVLHIQVQGNWVVLNGTLPERQLIDAVQGTRK